MSYLSVGTVPVQSDGLNGVLSPVVYGDIALSIKINTQINILNSPITIAVIKCAIDFPSSPSSNCQTRISHRRYHRINMSDFRSDLKEMPFVKYPTNSVSQLYDQYVHDLSHILDRHAPLVSSLKTQQHADWLSETYRLAKSLRRQFEHAWHKDKSQYNRSRLQRQIAWCNQLAKRDKTVYYRKLISDNSHDSKKMWRQLHKVLNRSHSTTPPTHESSKSNKIMKIRESFSSFESCNIVHPPVTLLN